MALDRSTTSPTPLPTPDREAAATPPDSARDAEMARSIGQVLRGLRRRRGLSLTELSESAGVSTSMLSQIENGRSTPTVVVLWKIAKAFDVPLPRFLEGFESEIQATLVRRQETPLRYSRSGQCLWRNLKPSPLAQRGAFFELTVKAQASEDVAAVGERGWVNLALAGGELIVAFGTRRYALRQGDTLQFPADRPYTLINPTAEDALAYLVADSSDADSRP